MKKEKLEIVKAFYETLDTKQKARLCSHYDKVSSFISFYDWLGSYLDLPNILKTMCN